MQGQPRMMALFQNCSAGMCCRGEDDGAAAEAVEVQLPDDVSRTSGCLIFHHAARLLIAGVTCRLLVADSSGLTNEAWMALPAHHLAGPFLSTSANTDSY